jgi:hypothetical protein
MAEHDKLIKFTWSTKALENFFKGTCEKMKIMKGQLPNDAFLFDVRVEKDFQGISFIFYSPSGREINETTHYNYLETILFKMEEIL